MIILILLAGGVIMLTPFVWLVVSSLKPLEKVFIFPPEWIPDPVQWQNYPDALLYKPFGLYFLNTLRIVVLNLIAILFSASFCGYGFARIRFPG
ncbi:MAG: carbohydrate ABC transporter permease, partial [Caldilineaceae bacterium]|nr:carbohydrate ABC transporter permease [Caldilineaceae bacterium]